MSDFFSSGWSYFIAIGTVLSLGWCLWLLWVASKRSVMAGDNTTGHLWDENLVELNNPLPRWWAGLFIITVVFAVGYLIYYPGLGSFPGTAGWTSANQWDAEQSAAEREMAPLYTRFAEMPAAALAKDPVAMGIGERLFGNHCATCHGADARGSKGFPNLTDNDWLHGGSPEVIELTITKGRVGNMPAMAAAVGSADDVRNVANYVLSLSGGGHNNIAAQLGKSKFGVCAACHGASGQGNRALGAPNLSDDVWLHGWGEAAVVSIITQGKVNTMPAQEGKLSAAQIHVLAAYVWGLSNGSGTK